MSEHSESVKDYIQINLFSKTGEIFFNYEDAEDDIYQKLNAIGIRLTKNYIPGDSSFYLVESQRVQAAAVHTHHIVLVYKGMLEYIFRTASMMTGVECRQREPATKRFMPWENNMGSWLQGGEFEWKNEKSWWLWEPDYRLVFNEFVETLFVFLVLHEIGHFHNLHGERRTLNKKGDTPTTSDSFFIHRAVDEGDDKILADRIAGHVREIVADTFAFQFMVNERKYDFFPELRLPAIDSDSRSAMEVTNFAYCLYAVAAYFWALHYRSPMTNDSQVNSYPSHAFRLVSIEATSLEHGLCADRHDPAAGLKLGIQNYLTKLPIASGNTDFIDWRRSVDNKASEAHYFKICNITKHWSNMVFGVRDEHWLNHHG
ncbi:hypothetical protein KKI90_01415 [Xenorhabdus bovienii]|uniref:Uncharacterized protein n=2 Tax=Xenorhabdus TaxID=626 RepID=A0A0B6X738_XENBV|nr:MULTISPECIES: hypothetical protein [Xenorhabdus]MDE1476874.1 hypothetical protein [Xenorhabdus bovienii]MDE1485111.1 hypothetical protein [Xenorhabdus bovienii]MDE1494206.1 hypothetical protein [Xenorhabdus bovienii]MDE9444936.1 hypothetical protein [Xenorhabdus bovienii]MDE9475015.1 hypothetical protein [Xenorhabdus bovienii]